ncbi:MAG: GDP-mannose 4,6-dehydratase, partial [Acidimicrobiia bacterium]
DPIYQRPIDVSHLLGDSSKARRALGWKPTVDFHKLVQIMVEADHSNWARHLAGEVFPWDAPNFARETHAPRVGVLPNSPDA